MLQVVFDIFKYVNVPRNIYKVFFWIFKTFDIPVIICNFPFYVEHCLTIIRPRWSEHCWIIPEILPIVGERLHAILL